MRLISFAIFVIACSAAARTRQDRPAALPSPHIPEGLGVNIHFTEPQTGELEMIREAGFRWVRMDFTWDRIERARGVYNFAPYDRLVAELDRAGMRAVFILDYSNRNYDNDQSPHSEEGRAAFAKWAAASARHFAGRGLLWEIYNEPNIQFWRPKPNVDDYVKLALTTCRAVREAAPGESLIGPATSGVDLPFLETCFRAGLLEYWSGVSVHPYRQQDPESAGRDYRTLRTLIRRYAPAGRSIPILSGEWGYSSAWAGMDERKQARMLARQWLTNLSNDIPLSIWYDWRDDGPDPREPEHHFGTVLHPYLARQSPVYDPKPAYRAAQTLTSELMGFRLSKRLMAGGPDDYVLLFARGSDLKLAAWTTSDRPHEISIPASPGRFRAAGHLGGRLPELRADSSGLAVNLTDSPQFLTPQEKNSLLQVAARWERAPLEIFTRAPNLVRLPATWKAEYRWKLAAAGPNDFSVQPKEAVIPTVLSRRALRDPNPVPVRLRISRPAGAAIPASVWPQIARLEQETHIVAVNPLSVALTPALGGALGVRVENPAGEPFRGMAELVSVEGLRPSASRTRLVFVEGEREKAVRFPLKGASREYRAGIRIADQKGNLVLATDPLRFVLVEDFSRFPRDAPPPGFALALDGDSRVRSEQSLAAGAPRSGPAAPGVGSLRLVYRFAPGWRFVQVVPRTEAARRIEGRPKGLGMWIYGDGNGLTPRLRIVDSTGQTFQPDGEKIGWTGWKYTTFSLDGSRVGHWGGAADGRIHYPIRWQALFLLDNTTRAAAEGTLYIAAPTLIY